MAYLIDVISTRHRADFLSAWRRAVEVLVQRTGFNGAELFEMERGIRNAHYDYVGVIEGSDSVCSDGTNFGQSVNYTVERTLCRLDTHLVGAGAPEDNKGDSWLCNPFEITKDQIPEVLEMWDKAKDHMVAKEGFIDARLFCAQSEAARYGLINIAHWRSAESFMAALDDKGYDRHREQSMNYSLHPSLCSRVAAVYPEDAHPRPLGTGGPDNGNRVAP